MQLVWQWEEQSPAHANYGNANQWTVGAGLSSLARETAQNSNDARLGESPIDLVFTLIRLTGEHREAFEQAVGWRDQLRQHLESMREVSSGAVAANQVVEGMDTLMRSRSLVLLRVADYGCRGLGGPEYAGGDTDGFGDFVKLCRLDLFSGKSAAAGGSFGLGKAVYWRFSRLQTVLFNSSLSVPVNTESKNRLFGVQQGVVHRIGSETFQGRGHLGVLDAAKGYVRSQFADDKTVADLHLTREDRRPGTSALIVGFYDPDDPESALDGRRDLIKLADGLKAGVEESFWPALARRRMQVRIDLEENGELVSSQQVDAEETFTELVSALRAYDAGELSEDLQEIGDIVVRDVPIQVPRRRHPQQPAFEHTAKLVVTLSDDVKDSLENQVCLFRRPEMVVETIDHALEGRKFHAFLLAGAATNPADPSQEELRADDFLRHAEPPPHDRWIPRTGRRQVSQVNLNGVYVAPWRPSLVAIEREVVKVLDDLFGPPPPPPDTAPTSVLKHLKFLRSASAGGDGLGTPGARKPTVTMDAGWVENGRWVVDFTIRAQNRTEGWSITPLLALVGLDGRREQVTWSAPLEVLSRDGAINGQALILPHKPNARIVKALVRGVSTNELPIPAREAAVDVVLRALGTAPEEAAP